MQINLLSEGVITALNLAQSVIQKLVEGRDTAVVDVPSTAFHKVVLVGYFVCLVNLRWSLVISLQHLGNHYFG